MGTVETKYIPFFDGSKRRLDIYLPNNYLEKEYKIIYFHDGQNLFYDSRATYGKCWGIKDICDKKEYPFIIVGIFSEDKTRCNEYSPFPLSYSYAIGERPYWTDHLGDSYATWIRDELMPYIEQEYHIHHCFENTGICGSSLGGVMSSYMAAKYKNVFKYIGVFSLASWYNEKEHLNYIHKNSLNKDQYYYIYVGTEEFSVQRDENHNKEYLKNTRNYIKSLKDLGILDSHIAYDIYEGGHHCEQYWSMYVDSYFKIIAEK